VEAANRLYRQARIKGVMVILNRVRDSETEAYLRQRLQEHGLQVHGIIADDPAITRAWLMGEELELGPAQAQVDQVLRDLEQAEIAP
jgi:CO dehydrogenase nickel-insertion accessory protein CooC1